MLNTDPLWKLVLVAAIIVLGALYALPNIYGDNPAVQVSASRTAPVDENLRRQVEVELEALGIEHSGVTLDGTRVDVRLDSDETQLRVQDVLRESLGRQYVVALKLAPATPGWLRAINALPMYLGLDLRGGVHFLLQVDMDGAERIAEERYASDVRSLLQGEKIAYRGVRREGPGGLLIVFRDAQARAAGERELAINLPGLAVERRELPASEEGRPAQPALFGRLRDEVLSETREAAIDQNLIALRQRVNDLGVAEPVVQRQGAERIVVQLPGIQDSARAKKVLGRTATLEFRLTFDGASPLDAVGDRVPTGARRYFTRDGQPVLLERSVMLAGNSITGAASGLDHQNGSPAVFIDLDGKGARLLSRRTRDKIGRSMATVYMEKKSETVTRNGEQVVISEDIEEVINVAVIRDQLGARFQITGLDSSEEARDLALALGSGRFAAPITIIEERTVGPSLGQENIDRGFRAVVIGFALVIVFMALYYRAFGVVANLALATNLVLIVAVLSALQATLTLPGIAGIVLTVGMAVDANVIIFERIREELRNGMSPQASIHAGYSKAFSTILDANVTTLIAAAVLFAFGTGPVKGFAVTLAIGIVTSMFTAIVGTRAVVNLYYGGRTVDRLSIGLNDADLPKAPRRRAPRAASA